MTYCLCFYKTNLPKSSALKCLYLQALRDMALRTRNRWHYAFTICLCCVFCALNYWPTPAESRQSNIYTHPTDISRTATSCLTRAGLLKGHPKGTEFGTKHDRINNGLKENVLQVVGTLKRHPMMSHRIATPLEIGAEPCLKILDQALISSQFKISTLERNRFPAPFQKSPRIGQFSRFDDFDHSTHRLIDICLALSTAETRGDIARVYGEHDDLGSSGF